MLYLKQQGKSFTEMLSVLAIIGILSVIGTIGLKSSFDKNEANKIVSDVHFAYFAISSDETFPTEWHLIREYSPESALLVDSRRDLSGHAFVRVSDVRQSVCKKLLDMVGDRFQIYQEDGIILKECVNKTENLVFSFDENAPVVECNTWMDCAELSSLTDKENYTRLCLDEICTSCPIGYEADSLHQTCESVCKDGKTLCLNTQLNQFWCCDSETELCGEQIGEKQCIVSDNRCIYNFYTSTSQELINYTDCSCYVDNSGNVGCDTSCKENFYCSLQWTKSSWNINQSEPKVADTSSGRIYGKCMPMAINSSLPLTKDISGGNGYYTVVQDCPEAKYCVLQWSDDNSCTNILDSQSGLFYGVCSLMNKKESYCPYSTKDK